MRKTSLLNRSGLTTVAVAGMALLGATAAQAQQQRFDIASGELETAIRAYVKASGQKVALDGVEISGLKSPGARGDMLPQQALTQILSGTNLKPCTVSGGYVLVGQSANCPTSDATLTTIAPVVVTAVSHLADRNRTGTRMDADPMTLPMSVSTVDHELLERQQALTLGDAVTNVAGVVPGVDGSFQIRGFSAGAMRNGTLTADGTMNDVPIVAVSRVEVVKGPEAIIAGVLSRYGGVVNLITKTPSANPTAEFTATGGSHGYYNAGGDVGGALTKNKNLLGRLVFSTQDSDHDPIGYRGAYSDYVSPSLTWKVPRWGTEITAQYEYQNLRKTPLMYIYTNGDRLTDDLFVRRLGPVSDGTETRNRNATLTVEQRLTGNWKLAVRYAHNEQERETRTGLNGIGTTYGFPWPNIFSIGYRGDAQAQVDSVKVELKGKFATGPIAHSLLLAYDDTSSDVRQGGQYTDARTINLATGQITDQTAAFGALFGGLPTPRFTGGLAPKEKGYLILDQMTWKKWVVLGGYRKVEYSPNVKNQPSLGTFNKSLPSLGVVYRATSTLSLYTSASKGFEPNLGLYGFGGSPVAPENADQIEGGVKALLFNERIAATASVYEIRQKNVAIVDPANPDPVCAGGSVCYISAKGVTSRGFEVEVSGEVLPGLQVRANYAYLEKKADTPNQIGITYAPHTASLWASYNFSQNKLGWWVGGNLRVRSARNDGGPLYIANPGNVRLDLNTGYDAPKWSMVAGVKNVADERLYTVDSGYFGAATMVQPREFYLTFRYRFQ
uniref:TonB-dependent siderophore receptor n=1 Tax=uncultured Caulobacter sp. TaxID=158749 RepID=UPI0025EA4D9E|nr:TonB-dependent receptor [uncultured Caulobacter sp.]